MTSDHANGDENDNTMVPLDYKEGHRTIASIIIHLGYRLMKELASSEVPTRDDAAEIVALAHLLYDQLPDNDGPNRISLSLHARQGSGVETYVDPQLWYTLEQIVSGVRSPFSRCLEEIVWRALQEHDGE